MGGRPVSVLIPSYNQAEFVCRAVDSALAQSFKDIEIVVADDASTDGSVRAVRDFLKTRSNPSNVTIVEAEKNRGTLANVVNAARACQGRLIIINNADDVSHEDRAEQLVATWNNGDCWALYSDYRMVDEQDRNLPGARKKTFHKHFFSRLFRDGQEHHFVLGATAAYDRRVFDLPMPRDRRILKDDAFLSFVVNLHGKPIQFVDRELVSYRTHGGSQTNRAAGRAASAGNIADAELRSASEQESHLALYELYEEYLNDMAPEVRSRIDIDYLRRFKNFARCRSEWWRRGLCFRLNSVRYATDRENIKWALPRLLGLKFYANARHALNRL